MGATGAAQRTGGFARALTTFVGRADETDRLSRLLTRHRLVTVTGPGGVGKTRLTAELLAQSADRLAERIWVVELAAVVEPQQVESAVAALLGVQERVGRSTTRSVAEVLAGERSLLVLDNCEQVVGAVADLCAELLSLSDDVRILATSREPIGVAGEVRLRLRPLPVESPGSGGETLFVERARLVDSTFELNAESAALVTQIVARLDGLPLAIELAAARYESLGLVQLLERLDAPLQVLADGARTAPLRHRSLWATADWSYQLLTEQQRRVFRRIAVLPGSFTLDAAEAVAGRRPVGSAVLHLVDCSLLAPPRDGWDGVGSGDSEGAVGSVGTVGSVGSVGNARYLMLDALRSFAAQHLAAAGERDDAMSAMAAYALSAARDAAKRMEVPGEEVAAARTFDADDTLWQHALSWALDHDQVTALHLAVALSPWWQLRGRALTGYPLLHRAWQGYGRADDSSLAAQKWLGRLAHSTANWRRALTHFDALCDSLTPDPPSIQLVDALAGRSGTLRNLSRLPEAIDTASTALELARRVRYADGEALALAQLSLADSYANDTAAATGWSIQAAQIDSNRISDAVARRIALVLTITQAESGELQAARETCAKGLAWARTAGDVTRQADFLYLTTHIALRAGEFDDAGEHIRESLRLTAQSGDRLRIRDCLDDCARLCAATRRWAEAVTLWAARAAPGAALDMPELRQDVEGRIEPLRDAEAHLGPRATRDAERRGAAMSLDTASEFAAMLAGSDPPTTPGPPTTVGPTGTITTTGPAGSVQLTPREKELITLVAQGRTDAQIAADLFISIRTVRSHLDRIRDKSGSRRRADLTRLALRAGLV